MVNADELVDVEAPKEQDEVKPTNPGTQEAPKSNVENDKEDAACANPKDAPEVADNADMAQNCAGKDPKSDEGNTEDYPNDEFDVEAPRKQEAMDLSPSLAASNDKANESLDYGSVEGGKAIEIMTPGSPGDTEHDVSFESTEGTIELPSPSSQPKRRSRKTFYLVAFLMVLLIGCALAVVFGTGLVDGEDSSTPSAGSQGDTGDAEPTSPPTTGGDTDSPPTSGTDTPAQTEPPTDPPTDPLLGTLMTFSKTGLDDPTSPQCQAYQWLATEDTLTDKSTDSARLQQRYALATMLFSVGGKLHMDAQEHECDWPGVMCAANSAYNTTAEEWQVTELNMTSQVCSNYAVGCQSVELAGTIPPEIGLLAPSLVRVDISSNPYLHGSIPDEFYDLSELEYMYLENNALTGQLSEDIGKLTLLSALYVGSNKLTGPIPYNLGARQGASRLREFARPLFLKVSSFSRHELTFAAFLFYTLQATSVFTTIKWMDPFLKL